MMKKIVSISLNCHIKHIIEAKTSAFDMLFDKIGAFEVEAEFKELLFQVLTNKHLHNSSYYYTRISLT